MMRLPKVKNRRLSKEQWARRGHSIYRRRILPKLAGEKKGRMVAIDIDTADFEVADDTLTAANSLLARQPQAKIWLEQIGFRTAVRMGAWNDPEKDQ
ncbi:MAG TPA: hypothetical protein VFC39_05100 [Acidobacteriaceae bacterium]|nr:hypothetical protein [Acidobacteriaceae bacterium]